MDAVFEHKDAARDAVWNALDEEGAARFPFPPHGRIPNFEGAEEAARHLFRHEPFAGAEQIKVNPDAPQRYVRIEALRRGCVVFVPSPRLRRGFKCLDPDHIPEENIAAAAALSNMDEWAEPVAVEALPPLDGIVSGSVAVTKDGRRCGKGEGFSDLEYALLRELGHDPVPVATTVHPLQVVDRVPAESHDLPLSLVVTPAEAIRVHAPSPPPPGIEWASLSEEDLEEMPVLRRFRERTG